MNTSAFHVGEQTLQTRSGVRERLEAVGLAVIRDHMPDPHRELFGKLPTLLLGIQDDKGQPWATMLQGCPGFVSSPDARGGRPGFIRVDAGTRGTRLTLPDYLGNFFFNTLGNLLAWPRAGLLVLDFEDGSVLQLSAQASIEFDGPGLDAFPGAQRLLDLDVLEGWWRAAALPLRWSAAEVPPQFAG